MMEAITFTLIILLAVREYATYKERQKLLDRIMSKNYTDFKDLEEPEENEYPQEDKSKLDIEDAMKEVVGNKEEE